MLSLAQVSRVIPIQVLRKCQVNASSNILVIKQNVYILPNSLTRLFRAAFLLRQLRVLSSIYPYGLRIILTWSIKSRRSNSASIACQVFGVTASLCKCRVTASSSFITLQIWSIAPPFVSLRLRWPTHYYTATGRLSHKEPLINIRITPTHWLWGLNANGDSGIVILTNAMW